MWNKTGGGVCRAHPTPAQTQSAGGSVQHQWKSEWCPLEKNYSTPYSISPWDIKLQRMKCQMDLVTSLKWVQRRFVYQLCVPHLCLRIHWVLPGDLSIFLAAWQTGGYEMLNVMLNPAVPGWAQKRLGFLQLCVQREGNSTFSYHWNFKYEIVSLWLNFAFCIFIF